MTKRRTGHIRQRTPGSWEIRYTLGTDRTTGRRRIAPLTVTGSRKDAERELRKRLHTLDEGQHVDPSRLTVADYIETWLTDWASSNVSAKSLERYGELLRNHVAPNIGKVLLQKLTVLDLTQMYGKLLREGRGEGIGPAGRTVLHVHRVIHRSLRHAVQWRLVATNVASSTDAPKAEHKEIEILDSAQARDVLEKLPRRNAPGAKLLYSISSLALGTGMRRGELLALRWQDVDLDAAVLRVERSLEQTKAKGLRFKAPKTAHGRRSITLPAFAVSDLRAHWKAQMEARIGKPPGGALVFPGPDFEPRSPNALTKEWAAAAKSLDVAVSFHAWRHTHASQLIASGSDVLTISRRLGHGSPAITLKVYGHLFKSSDDRAVKVLDAAFSSSTE